jgi:hypothetical protein
MTDHANKRSRSAWTLENKIWLLDLKDEAEKRGQKCTALDLGAALAVHVNSKRKDDRVPIEPMARPQLMNGFKMSKVSGSKRQNLTIISDVPKCRSIQKWRRHSSYGLSKCKDRELAITVEMLVEKANEIGKLTNVPEDFKFSSGWLYNWKKRRGHAWCACHCATWGGCCS